MITYTRQAGDAEGFVLVPDDAPPPPGSPATSSSSSPPTPRPPPPTVEPPPPGLGQNAGQSPGQSPEPATAPRWAKCTRWGLRLALKKKLWAHLGSHLKYIKPVGVADDASGTSRRREGGARLTRVGSGLTSPPHPRIQRPTRSGCSRPGSAPLFQKKLERRHDQSPRLDGRRDQSRHEAGERFGAGDANAVRARKPHTGLRRFGGAE